MFGLFKASQPKLLHIEGTPTPLPVGDKETILNAALRQGIRFPHSCRVGGCATCKCRLTRGKVKELTEAAYVLSAEELDQGYILACQSVPRGEVHIALDQPPVQAPDPIRCWGTVVAQQALTHDITALDIELEPESNQALHYAAGQYARLSVPGHIDTPRSYSFATPATASGQRRVRFFIRQVPGGEMSSWAQGPVLASRVRLEGPYGDFYLRESPAQPILCIAGGSGLAPIKALLEDALAHRNPRPVTFLFGARSQQDLYCLAELQQLQEQWAGDFRFIPVLSEEPAASDWNGARGLVTDHLEQYCDPRSQAYLCGPPAMLDAAEHKLQQLGIPPQQCFSDKFLDQSSQANAQ
ncbi:NADH:ubiquinone reductase (Na(+)-transporting) subunit F [Ketobacter sp.]|uniref:NADH:ubiquinone reductase (Na(+)-transporting) subunit F n=1 Tax=Ketobacter sp. TaxID=2083498 RepID=UPI000F0E24F7|nr:2Fe-2S iron-sulfur cluster binding domain-containing protein [Ketobacter sp.]RLT95104.1 MAG: oxidoreductase [Ketobacter sp.]